ncbi:tRNA pseudouridine(38-40) synthase TruA [Rubellimicrobium aerolatum]|uniref:tRNA pseudouridine synthase A n=1 Tax=Rubellimicrobium aerolatum TaxID=490979 RepID=A0ABW0SAP9_9RHOB|nr:tRNA pseudouridine(38-40) synthase TruA [Rubellimicrobium aerolatum]MBP1806138.1 tRNA pseudouridine38-40 synthase [Rubellimicrobium aerolatum]
MPRYALKLEYLGAPFAGWQRQADQPSVQGALEAALLRLDPGPHAVAAAGRTDAGVHAWGQVAHCDMGRDWDPFRLSEALNAHLRPHPVAVTACARVADDWHARFSALERGYLYRIALRRAPLVLGAGRAWRVGRMLDAAAMAEGAAHLLGRHDFTTFRSSMCQADSPLRTLDELSVARVDGPEGPEVHVRARARSFLHNQVRSIVGSLERVGAGAWTPARMAEALAARDRAACGPVAPPDGLHFTHVRYDPDPFGSEATGT